MKRFSIYITLCLLVACHSLVLAQGGCSPALAHLNEGFEDWGSGLDSWPSCWFRFNNFDGQYPRLSAENASSGSTSLMLSSGTATNHFTLAASPEMQPTVFAGTTLSFKAYSTSVDAVLEVGYCADTDYTSPNFFVPLTEVRVDESGVWQTFTISITEGSGRVAWRMRRSQQSGTRFFYIDDIKVAQCGLVDATISNVGSDRATLIFNTFGSPTMSLDYRVEGASQWTQSTGPIVSPYQLANLTPSSNYEVRVVASCSGENDTALLSLHTFASGSLVVPYCESFEGAATLPAGWLRPEYSSSQLADGTNMAPVMHYGNNSLRLKGSSIADSCSTLLLPALSPSVSDAIFHQLKLTFWAYCLTGTNVQLTVGVVEFPDEPSSFVPVQTVSLDEVAVWQQFVVDFSSYTGSGRYVALRASSPMAFREWIYVDDLLLSTVVAHSQQVAARTNTQVTIEWQLSGTATGIHIEYDSAGFVRGTGHSVDLPASATSYTALGIGSNSTIHFWIEPVYAASNRCVPAPLVAESSDMNVAPSWCETFSLYHTGVYPDQWGRPLMVDGYPIISSTAGLDEQSLEMYASAQSGTATMAVLPRLDYTPVNDLYLNFWVRSGSGQGRIVIGMLPSKDNYVGFTGVDTVVFTQTDDFEFHSIPLASYSGSYRYVAFKFEETVGTGTHCWIDGVSVTTCQVTNVHLYDITNTTVTLVWDTAGSVYDGSGVWVEYAHKGTPFGNGTRVLADEVPFVVPGLTPNTEYSFYVWGNCNATSNDCTPNRYDCRTLPERIQNSYCQSFDLPEGSMPPAWQRPVRFYGDPVVNATSCTTPGSLRMHATNVNGVCYAVSPMIETTSGVTMRDLKVTFRAYSDLYECRTATVDVGVMTLPWDTSTFTLIDTFRLLYPGYWEECAVDLAPYTGTGRYVALRYRETVNDSYIYIDEFKVAPEMASNVHAIGITNRSFQVRWDTLGTFSPQAKVYIEYGPAGFADGSGTRLRATSNPMTISGLSANTNYEFCLTVEEGRNHAVCHLDHITLHTLANKMEPTWCYDFGSDDVGSKAIDFYYPVYYYNFPQVTDNDMPYSGKGISLYCNAPKHEGNDTLGPIERTVVVAPMLETDVHQVAMDYRVYAYNSYTNLRVGVMTDPYDLSSFEEVDVLRNTYAYNNYDWSQWGYTDRTVTFQNYTGNGRYIAFILEPYYLDGYERGSSASIDAIAIRNCHLYEPRVHHVTQTTATVSWDEPTGILAAPTEVWCEYKKVSYMGDRFAPGTGTRVKLDSNNYLITGLEPSSFYSFHLIPKCATSDPECQFTVIPIYTLDPPFTVPMHETFDTVPRATWPLYGWRPTVNGWSTYYLIDSAQYHSATHSLFTYTNSANYVLPDFIGENPDPCTSLKNLALSFWTYDEYGNNNPLLEVGIMEDAYDTTTFTRVATIKSWRQRQWERHSVDFSNYTGTGKYICLRSLTSWWFLDDLSVEHCIADSMRVECITPSQVSISWASRAVDSMLVVYGTSLTNTDTLHLTENPYVISNIVPDTRYYYQLSPQCGCDSIGLVYAVDDDTITPSPYIDSTLCENNYADYPYCENFDSYDIYGRDLMPRKWHRFTGSDLDYPALTTSYSETYYHSIKFHSYTSRDNRAKMSMVVLPALDSGLISQSHLMLDYNVHVLYGLAPNTSLEVGVMTNPNDSNSFELVGEIPFTYATQDWYQAVVDLSSYSGEGQYIALRLAPQNALYYGSHEVELYIDNLQVAPCVVSNIYHNFSADSLLTLTWSGQGAVAPYQVEYGPRHFAQGSGTAITTADTSTTIAGLDPVMSYDFYISPACSTSAPCKPYNINHEIDLPYCQDFEHDLYYLPQNWHEINSYSYISYVNDRFDNQTIALVSYRGIAQLPTLAVSDIENVYLYLDTKYDGYDTLPIYVVTMGYNNEVLDTLATLNRHGNHWFDTCFRLSSYHDTTRRIAFARPNGSACSFDNVSLSRYPTPYNVHWTTQSLDYRDIYWDSPAPLTGFSLEIGPQGFYPGEGAGTVIPISESGHLRINIDFKTDSVYDFYFIDPDGHYTCQRFTFTAPSRRTLPYCNNFNLSTDPREFVHEIEWHYIRSADCYAPFQGSVYDGWYRRNIDNGIVFGSSNALCPTQWAVLPEPDRNYNVSDLYLHFDLYSQYTTVQRLVVGVLTDRDDTNTFIPIDTVFNTSPNNWRHHSIKFASYADTGRFVALRWLPDSTGGNIISISNVLYDHCPHPEFRHIGATTIEAYVKTDSVADYYIEHTKLYGDINYIHATSNSYIISDLEPYWRHYFSSTCDSGSSSCVSSQSLYPYPAWPLPYCEDFSYGNAAWQFKHNYNNGNESNYPRLVDFPNDGNTVLDFYAPDERNLPVMATLPDFEVDSAKRLYLDFDLYSDFDTNNAIVVGMVYDRFDTTSFRPLDTLRVEADNLWRHKSVSFTNYDGRSRWVTLSLLSPDYGHHIYVDNLYVQTCPYPDLTIANHNTVKAFVPTGETDVDYYVEYGRRGYRRGVNYDAIVHVTTNPFYITDLLDTTDYDFYPMCDSLGSTCRLPQQLRTSLELPLPYCQNFDQEQQNTMPQYWNQRSNNPAYPSVGTGLAASEPQQFTFFSDYAYQLPEIAILPGFIVSELSQLNFTGNIYSADIDNLNAIIFGIMPDTRDALSFVALDTVWPDTSFQWSSFHASLRNTTLTDGFPAIKFHCPTLHAQMVLDNLAVDSCQTADLSLVGYNVARLTTVDSLFVDYYVEYGPQGFVQGSGTTLHVDASPYLITLDANDSAATPYDFYFKCDPTTTSCRAAATLVASPRPVPMGFCENFDSASSPNTPFSQHWHSLVRSAELEQTYVRPVAHASHSPQRSVELAAAAQSSACLVMPQPDIDTIPHLLLSFYLMAEQADDAELEVGVLTDRYDMRTFIPVKLINAAAFDTWQHVLVGFDSYTEQGLFPALRLSANSSPVAVVVDDIHYSDCGIADYGVTQIAADSITIGWHNYGNPTVSLYLREKDLTFYPTLPNKITFAGLVAGNTYTFDLIFGCDTAEPHDYCSTADTATFTIVTPAISGGCIDFTNLSSPSVVATTGTYNNPYAHYGLDPDRHVVLYDAQQTDPNTGGLLHVTPPNGGLSVRLGNWKSGAQAESISYTLDVDTSNFSVLLFNYAAVLQNPAHTEDEQPKLRIEVLDTTLHVIDSQCVIAEFAASTSLGWNSSANYVLWKDWTTVGLNVAPYHGQPVIVRITTYDCAPGDHYGYAYFSLECAKGYIASSACGSSSTATLYGIDGFSYRWYSADSPATIATTQAIDVNTDQVRTYYCEHHFLGNPNCYFTLAVDNRRFYPVARYNYNVTPDDCRYVVDVHSTSFMTFDGTTPAPEVDPLELTLWDFGNGLQSSNPDDTLALEPGNYDVSLIVSTRHQCADTAHFTLSLPAYVPDTNYLADTSCQFTPYSRYGFALTPDSTDYRTSHTYTTAVSKTNGCPIINKLHLALSPYYHLHRYDTIEMGNYFTFEDTTLTLPGVYERLYTTVAAGCDSLITQHLSIVAPKSSYTDSCQTHINIVRGDTLVVTPVPYEFELSADRPAHEYTWHPGQGLDTTTARTVRLTLKPDTVATLVLHVLYSDTNNIVPNGGFELGDTLFSSDYTPLPAPHVAPSVATHSGTYAVVGSAFLPACLASAPAALLTYPVADTALRLYHTTLAVDPYTDYRLAYRVASLAQPDTVAHLWTVGDQELATPPLLPDSCEWTTVVADFATQADTLLHIVLHDTSYLLGSRAPYAIGQLAIYRLCMADDTVSLRTECPDYVDTIEVQLCHDSVYTCDDGSTISEPGVYTYSFTTEWGCDSIVTIRALYNPCCSDYLQFPNAVTPNGDGVNDRFVVVGLLEEWCYPFNELAIYNKWGERVYYRKNIRSDADFWDPNATNSPTGTYYFHFDATDPDGSRHVQRRGVIEVIR